MIAVRWPDGRITRARTWQGVLGKVNRYKWNRKFTEEELRHELASRAYRWSGTLVNPVLPPRELFVELESAKMLEVIRDDA